MKYNNNILYIVGAISIEKFSRLLETKNYENGSMVFWCFSLKKGFLFLFPTISSLITLPYPLTNSRFKYLEENYSFAISPFSGRRTILSTM